MLESDSLNDNDMDNELRVFLDQCKDEIHDDFYLELHFFWMEMVLTCFLLLGFHRTVSFHCYYSMNPYFIVSHFD